MNMVCVSSLGSHIYWVIRRNSFKAGLFKVGKQPSLGKLLAIHELLEFISRPEAPDIATCSYNPSARERQGSEIPWFRLELADQLTGPL